MHMNNGTMESQVDLSIVIRARNQGNSLKQVLEALEAQQCSFKGEIIIVDHESQDETVELCKQYKAQWGSRRYQWKIFGKEESDETTVGRQARLHSKKQGVVL